MTTAQKQKFEDYRNSGIEETQAHLEFFEELTYEDWVDIKTNKVKNQPIDQLFYLSSVEDEDTGEVSTYAKTGRLLGSHPVWGTDFRFFTHEILSEWIVSELSTGSRLLSAGSYEEAITKWQNFKVPEDKKIADVLEKHRAFLESKGVVIPLNIIKEQ